MSEKPNVILLIIDGLRADRLGCYGYERDITPNIDSFSKGTMFFETAISQGNYTIPAVGSILTGLFPFSHGATPKTKLSPKIKTWPQRMKELGYATCGFVGGAYVSKEFGFNVGFDEFYEDKESVGLAKKQRLFDNQQKLFEWLGKNKERPFFLFLHGFDVHVPFQPPKEFAEKFCSTEEVEIDTNLLNMMKVQLREGSITEKQLQRVSDLYDAEINYFDFQFGKLLQELKRFGLLENSYIIITSDHGIAFKDHGEMAYGGFNFYDELIKVPLMIKVPNKNYDKKIKALIRHIDIMPTILDFEGIKLAESIAGQSLKKIIDAGLEESHVMSYYENMSDSRSIRAYRDSKWKLIEKKTYAQKAIKRISLGNFFRYFRNFFKTISNSELRSQLGGKIELYNLSKDPLEKENLANKLPEKVTELIQKMNKFKEDYVNYVGNRTKPLSGNINKLKTLGYL